MSTIVDTLFLRIWTFVFVKALQKKKVRTKLGKKISAIRKAQKISQAQLAFESGLSRQYISYLESGLKSPTLDTLVAIADVMGIHVRQLLDFEY
jgi:DNA-binding XRE family transcriptional regulator